MKQLIHNGILVPTYKPKGLHIAFKGRKIELSSEQEEMALAWVKKLGTVYVEEQVFVDNFFKDFSRSLGIRDNCTAMDFDFSEIKKFVESERRRRESMSKAEKKASAEMRKKIREANKKRYGYAIVDGKRVEVSNYTAEPSSIFIGRGRHPLRGRWKQGPKYSDIILNLSPDACMPEGDWKGRVWQPEAMWIAKWRDSLRGKIKYVWLSGSFSVKQKREIEKFNKARMLEKRIEKVRAHIERNLVSRDPLRRKIATVCYLIDALKLRVGDEKDKDEADTVGATTLKPEHISFHKDGLVIFDFLGKDSVHWHIERVLPRQVVRNIEDFIAKAESSIFKGVRSDNVSDFLDEAMQGLTAKVFRTYHATKIVKKTLEHANISAEDPAFLKNYVAKKANLEAAKTCNHKKKIPKNWESSLLRMEERLKKLEERRREISAKNARKIETKIKRLKKIDERIKKLQLRIELKKDTKEYNLNTSLKSYIDPRVYHQWSKRVGYDWKLCYSKALQRRFQWVESG